MEDKMNVDHGGGGSGSGLGRASDIALAELKALLEKAEKERDKAEKKLEAANDEKDQTFWKEVYLGKEAQVKDIRHILVVRLASGGGGVGGEDYARERCSIMVKLYDQIKPLLSKKYFVPDESYLTLEGVHNGLIFPTNEEKSISFACFRRCYHGFLCDGGALAEIPIPNNGTQRRILLQGTPGIGKTTFSLFLIPHLIIKEKYDGVVFQESAANMITIFRLKSTPDGRQTIRATASNALPGEIFKSTDKPWAYVCDSSTPHQRAACELIFCISSLGFFGLKKFNKVVTSRLIFPVWTKEEFFGFLKSTKQSLTTNMALALARFDKYGGAIRHIYIDMGDPADHVRRLEDDDVKNLFKEAVRETSYVATDSNAPVFDRYLHLFPKNADCSWQHLCDFHPQQFFRAFPTVEIRLAACDRLQKMYNFNLHNTLLNAPSPFRGHLMEAFFHRKITDPSATPFDVSLIAGGDKAGGQRPLPRCDKWEKVQNIESIDAYFGDISNQPCLFSFHDPNHPAIDSAIVSRRGTTIVVDLLQVTVADRHPIARSGLVRIARVLEKLGWNTASWDLRFVFVVPDSSSAMRGSTLQKIEGAAPIAKGDDSDSAAKMIQLVAGTQYRCVIANTGGSEKRIIDALVGAKRSACDDEDWPGEAKKHKMEN